MKYRDRYPENWYEIASKIKKEAKWRCQICSLSCIPSGISISNMDRSERARYRLEVHHINGKPEDNAPTNLIALCSTCHLRQHQRRRGNVPVGQLSLKLQL